MFVSLFAHVFISGLAVKLCLAQLRCHFLLSPWEQAMRAFLWMQSAYNPLIAPEKNSHRRSIKTVEWWFCLVSLEAEINCYGWNNFSFAIPALRHGLITTLPSKTKLQVTPHSEQIPPNLKFQVCTELLRWGTLPIAPRCFFFFKFPTVFLRLFYTYYIRGKT